MVYVGIDDTDMPDTRGTNQLAKQMAAELAADWHCQLIVRHQLLDDPRVPYTSQNGSASLLFHRQPSSGTASTGSPENVGEQDLDQLKATCRRILRECFVEGSDPGLCVTVEVPPEITEFGLRCQRELIYRQEAEDLARQHGIYLEGLGGTCGGMIGALAAVGLAVTGNDGRVVHLGGFPEEIGGRQPVGAIHARGVEVRDSQTGNEIHSGTIHLGKKLRPNRRDGRTVLFVSRSQEPDEENLYTALKLR